MTLRAVVRFIEPECCGEEVHTHQTEDEHHQEQDTCEIPHARNCLGHGLHQHAEIRPLLGELEDAEKAESTKGRCSAASKAEKFEEARSDNQTVESSYKLRPIPNWPVSDVQDDKFNEKHAGKDVVQDLQDSLSVERRRWILVHHHRNHIHDDEEHD